MSTLIEPRVLKGFRDFLPRQEIRRAELTQKLTDVFKRFGFVPIDTPALEYSEILLRKSGGETEKQVFRFEDNGGRDVALRFDLTVPFARFVAEHASELYFPFKRYHTAKVWRGEKPQAGRYREFTQCDFDIVGADSASADFEILSLMKTALSEIGAGDVKIHISHRGVFNRFLARLGIGERFEPVMRAVDKRSKCGAEETEAALLEIAGKTAAGEIIEFISTRESFAKTLDTIERLAGGEDDDTRRLREIYELICAMGAENSFELDPSITRGLDYYTGVVCETFLTRLPSIGSICSGGRYNNLAGLYMKERVPGVGASIGLDRLIAALESLNDEDGRACFTDAVVFCADSGDAAAYHRIAADLRANGVGAEVFPEPKKMAQQYAWAEKKGVPWGVTIDAETFRAGGTFTIKYLPRRLVFENVNAVKAAELIKERKV